MQPAHRRDSKGYQNLQLDMLDIHLTLSITVVCVLYIGNILIIKLVYYNVFVLVKLGQMLNSIITRLTPYHVIVDAFVKSI